MTKIMTNLNLLKDNNNSVTAVGTVLPFPIIHYINDCPAGDDPSLDEHFVTEFMLSVKQVIDGTEKESIIQCRTANLLAEWVCDEIQTNDRVRISGKLSLSSSALIDVSEIEVLEQDTQPDQLCASFTGQLMTSPHLFLSNPDHPRATYVLEIETDEDYTYIQVPCTAVGPLCSTVESDFHHGTYVTVQGNLHTNMHQEISTMAYDIYHAEPSIEDMSVSFDTDKNPALRTKFSVYLPELFVTSNALTPEEQTRKNREQACFQIFLQKHGLINQN